MQFRHLLVSVQEWTWENRLFLVLLIFWLAWTFMVITDRQAQREFVEHVDHFMNRGDRFTAGDGYELCKRIQHLEQSHHGSTSLPCHKPRDMQDAGEDQAMDETGISERIETEPKNARTIP